MLISKSTSDPLLVATLVVKDAQKNTIAKLSSFNTDTLQAVDHQGATITADSFGFYFMLTTISDVSDVYSQLLELLPDNLKNYIYSGKSVRASMVWEAGDPNRTLTVVCKVSSYLVRCSGCSTTFLAYLDPEGGVWSAAKVNSDDKHPTMTKLTAASMTCDSCSQAVTLST